MYLPIIRHLLLKTSVQKMKGNDTINIVYHPKSSQRYKIGTQKGKNGLEEYRNKSKTGIILA